MIIKIKDYDGKPRIFSFAKSERVKYYLLEKELNTGLLSNRSIIIYPENITLNLSEEETQRFSLCADYDVFQVDSRGNAYKYFNNASLDNAILVTNRCNSNCVMCPTAESIRRNGENYYGDELIRIAKYFPNDVCHITITGGEPFLIGKSIFDLLSFLKDNLPNTSYLLLTNGRIFSNKEYLNLFKQTCPHALKLGIPIHGYNSETHDSITQAKGSFIQTFNGLLNLLSIGAKIELRIVVSRLNADFITDIAKLITDNFLGIECVKFIGLEMTGNAAKNKNRVWISYPDAFRVSKKAIDLLIGAGIDVGLYNFPLCAVDKMYRSLCEKSISDYKIRYTERCEKCCQKDACGGMFAGTVRLSKDDIIPLGK